MENHQTAIKVATSVVLGVGSNVAAQLAVFSDNQLLAMGTFVVTIGGVLTSVVKSYWEGRERSLARDLAALRSQSSDAKVEHAAQVADLRDQIRTLLETIKEWGPQTPPEKPIVATTVDAHKGITA